MGVWLLWGGLAVLFGGVYAGAYVWMRRPRFGEEAEALEVPVDGVGPAAADGEERHHRAQQQ